jgi:hypothetical protein
VNFAPVLFSIASVMIWSYCLLPVPPIFMSLSGGAALAAAMYSRSGQGRWPSASACDLKYLSGWLTLVLPKRGDRFAEEKTREHAGHVVAIAPFVPDRSDAHNR